MIVLWLLACVEPDLSHWARPAQIARPPPDAGCAGFTVGEPVHVGGDVVAVLVHDGVVYGAGTTGLVVVDGDRVQRLSLPGEVWDVAWSDGLWVALGTGGVAHLRDPTGAAERVLHPLGGDIRHLAVSTPTPGPEPAPPTGTVWAADRTGRILSLRGGTWEATEVDGWPDGLTTAPAGVAWPSNTGQLTHSDGTDSPGQRVVWSGGHRWWLHAGALHRDDGARVEVPSRPTALLPDGDGIFVALGRAGLQRWAGEELVDVPVGDTPGTYVVDVVRDGETLWVAAANAGLLRVRGGEVTPVADGGVVEAGLADGDGLLVGVTTWNDSGRLARVDRSGVRWRRDIGGRVQRLRRLDDGGVLAAVSHRGLVRLDDGTATDLIPYADEVRDLARAPDGAWWVLVRGQGLVRAQPGEPWAETRSIWLGVEPHPGAIATLGDDVVVGWSYHGRLTWHGPHDGRVTALPGPSVVSPVPSRMVAVADRVWVAMPHHGLVSVDADGTLGPTWLRNEDVRAVASIHDGWVVALGTAGLARLAADGTVTGRCDLPGETIRLVADGDTVWALGGGIAVPAELW